MEKEKEGGTTTNSYEKRQLPRKILCGKRASSCLHFSPARWWPSLSAARGASSRPFFPPLFLVGVGKGTNKGAIPKKVFPGFSSNQQPCAPARPHPPFFTHPPSKSRWTYCPSHDLQFISALTWNINFVSCNQMKTLPRKTVNFHRNYFWHYQQYFPTRIETRHQLLNVLS